MFPYVEPVFFLCIALFYFSIYLKKWFILNHYDLSLGEIVRNDDDTTKIVTLWFSLAFINILSECYANINPLLISQ